MRMMGRARTAVYTYHEKEEDTEASGYRTENIRPGWDVLKDSTAVLLQRSHDPVINPDGFLYKREIFLEYILHQKISGR